MKRITQHTVIGELNVLYAVSFWQRLKGLLFTKSLDVDYCILLSPCTSVHTIGMLYPINIIFLDKNGLVLAIKNRISPNKVCIAPPKTKKVIEMSAAKGDIEHHIIGKKFMEETV